VEKHDVGLGGTPFNGVLSPIDERFPLIKKIEGGILHCSKKLCLLPPIAVACWEEEQFIHPTTLHPRSSMKTLPLLWNNVSISRVGGNPLQNFLGTFCWVN
jgi:hypothetical protein